MTTLGLSNVSLNETPRGKPRGI